MLSDVIDRVNLVGVCETPEMGSLTSASSSQLSQSRVMTFIAAARKCEAESGQPVRLIIVDTLAAATTGVDGSSDKDMALYASDCGRLQRRSIVPCSSFITAERMSQKECEVRPQS